MVSPSKLTAKHEDNSSLLLLYGVVQRRVSLVAGIGCWYDRDCDRDQNWRSQFVEEKKLVGSCYWYLLLGLDPRKTCSVSAKGVLCSLLYQVTPCRRYGLLNLCDLILRSA